MWVVCVNALKRLFVLVGVVREFHIFFYNGAGVFSLSNIASIDFKPFSYQIQKKKLKLHILYSEKHNNATQIVHNIININLR